MCFVFGSYPIQYYFQFFTVLLIMLIATIVAAVLGYVYRKQVDTTLDQTISGALDNYGNKTVFTNQIDFMQKEVKLMYVL